MTEARWGPVDRCRGCEGGAASLSVILEMDPMPLAGDFPPTRDTALASPIYPLTWVECGRCRLVQVLEDVPDEDLFRTYHYGSSSVPGLVRHFESYASELVVRFGTDRVGLLEIGCNDGVLLTRLPASWRRVGVDPSDVARRDQTGDYELINEPFTEILAGQAGLANSFDIVTSSNALAHFTDLAGALRGVHRLLRDGGTFIVEVHDLDATLRSGQWDTIYHEHKVEWSLASLRRCVEPIGFEVERADRLPLHGGLLRVAFTKVRHRHHPDIATDPKLYRGLQAAYLGRRETPTVRELLERMGRGERLSAYGASGRANVWLNQIPEIRFDYVVDRSPLRAGHWVPRAAVPILEPTIVQERPTDACLITAWNYADDIVAAHPEYRGRWLRTFAETISA